MTHTYSILEISADAFQEIYDKLVRAGYAHAFDFDTDSGKTVMDMQGIGLCIRGDLHGSIHSNGTRRD